ncbi:unnamed protein product [Urochloa humidicola]
MVVKTLERGVAAAEQSEEEEIGAAKERLRTRDHDPPRPRFPPHPEVLATREPQLPGGVFAEDRHPEDPKVGGGETRMLFPHPEGSHLW